MSQTEVAPQASIGSELRRSGRDYVVSAAGSYLVMALSLGLTIVTTRILGAAGYGQAALLLTVGQTLVFFATFWTSAGLVRLGSEAWLAEAAFHRVLWGRNLVMLVPFAVVCAAVWMSPSSLWGYLGVTGAARGAVFAYVLGLAVLQTSQFSFQALKRLRAYSCWQVAEKAALLALVWAGSAALRHDVSRLVWLSALTAGGIGVASLLALPRQHVLPIATDAATVKRFVRFSWPLLVSMACGYMSTNWVDLLVIKHYGSLESVGAYNLGYQIMGVVQMLPTLSFPVALPMLVTWQVEGREDGVRLYTTRLIPHAYVLLATGLIAAIALLGPSLQACFGEEFAGALVPAGWLLFSVGLYGIFISTMPLLNLWERTDVMLTAGAAAGIVNVLADLALVPRWGAVGAAWATILAYATSATIIVGAVRRRVTMPLRSLMWSLLAIGSSLAGCILMGGVSGYLFGLAGAAALLAVAVSAGQLFGHEERRWLWQQYAAHRAAPAVQV